ncbi:MAG: Rad52/Rad22 family DNA repair protein [Desulfatiglandaceae bacterium]
MNRELLEKPFEPGQIKQRVGTLGNTLDYIEGHAVIKRLNDAFDGKWSFEILRHEILEEKDEVVVLGKNPGMNSKNLDEEERDLLLPVQRG